MEGKKGQKKEGGGGGGGGGVAEMRQRDIEKHVNLNLNAI